MFIPLKGTVHSVLYRYIVYITVLGKTDFEQPIFSIISSQSCFIEMDLSLKMFLSLRHAKTLYIFKIGEQSFNSFKYPFKYVNTYTYRLSLIKLL